MPPQANTRTTAGVGAGTADADGDDNEQNDEENEQWEEEEEEEEGAPALADSCIDDDDEDDGFAVSAPNSGGGGVGAGSGAQATAMISLSSSASPQMWPVMSNTRSFLSAEHVTIRSGPAEQSPVTPPRVPCTCDQVIPVDLKTPSDEDNKSKKCTHSLYINKNTYQGACNGGGQPLYHTAAVYVPKTLHVGKRRTQPCTPLPFF